MVSFQYQLWNETHCTSLYTHINQSVYIIESHSGSLHAESSCHLSGLVVHLQVARRSARCDEFEAVALAKMFL